jgi:hypothetical protein
VDNKKTNAPEGKDTDTRDPIDPNDKVKEIRPEGKDTDIDDPIDPDEKVHQTGSPWVKG